MEIEIFRYGQYGEEKKVEDEKKFPKRAQA